MSIIDSIVEKTRQRVNLLKQNTSRKELLKLSQQYPQRSLKKALKKGFSVISEIKPASPSMGEISQIDATEAAIEMEKGGAAALSVLTEPYYFKGSLENLSSVKKTVSLPVLRKDFLLDEMQLYEAKAHGADAMLLMVSLVEDIRPFLATAGEIGLDVLVETHTEEQIRSAVEAGAEIIGINNRDFKTLTIDLSTTKSLLPLVPEDRLVVSESGVETPEDARFLKGLGVDAILVGTSVMKSPNIREKVASLVV